MNRLQNATSISITVLATLLIAAVAYLGTSARLHPTAAVSQRTPAPASPTPSEMPVVPTPIKAPTGPFVIAEDMLDPSTGWMLVSDCPLRANPTCYNAVVGTADGGQTWTVPFRWGRRCLSPMAGHRG